MPFFKVTVEILVEADDADKASGCIYYNLDQLTREFEPESEVIDWHLYAYPEPHDGSGFENVA